MNELKKENRHSSVPIEQLLEEEKNRTERQRREYNR